MRPKNTPQYFRSNMTSLIICADDHKVDNSKNPNHIASLLVPLTQLPDMKIRLKLATRACLLY